MDGASRPPAADSAYEVLRSRILSGELAPGERLVEQTLAEDLGLSRTPVREAIRRLVHEGFVEKGQGYSTRVAEFHEEELSQLFEIRRRLECYAAGRAAKMATEEEIARLRDLSDRMAHHTPPKTQEDYAIISAANAEFHRIIYEAARSPRLVALIASAVEGVIFTIEANGSRLRAIETAIQRLRDANANVFGAIVTKVDNRNSSYGYGYGDKYGYGYTYGKN